MIIYYFVKNDDNYIGSTNEHKIIKMSNGKQIYQCDISDFVGELLSAECNN